MDAALRMQGTKEEIRAKMKDICIYTRLHGNDMLWTLVVDGQPTKELNRDDICDMKDQMAQYIRQDGRDDLGLRTISGVIAIGRARVYSFEMECTSVLSRG
jgi:hypothetical protein